jgi:hypothetical protein
MAPEIRAFIAANDSQLNSKEIMVLTSLCLLLNIDGLVEELGLWPVLALRCPEPTRRHVRTRRKETYGRLA